MNKEGEKSIKTTKCNRLNEGKSYETTNNSKENLTKTKGNKSNEVSIIFNFT